MQGKYVLSDERELFDDGVAAECYNRVSECLRGIAADMRGIGASSMTPRELFAYWAHEVDKAADLADFLVSINPDGLPVGLTISKDGNLLNWRGENYVKQSAPDGECKVVASSTNGLITAEPQKWFELSCGHTFKLYGLGKPVACPVCGRKVVGR